MVLHLWSYARSKSLQYCNDDATWFYSFGYMMCLKAEVFFFLQKINFGFSLIVKNLENFSICTTFTQLVDSIKLKHFVLCNMKITKNWHQQMWCHEVKMIFVWFIGWFIFFQLKREIAGSKTRAGRCLQNRMQGHGREMGRLLEGS